MSRPQATVRRVGLMPTANPNFEIGIRRVQGFPNS